MSVLSPQARANLIAYNYDGEDRSFIYRYVLTPINAFLINFIPTWIAPNVITQIGGFVSMSSYMLSMYYSPNYDQLLPSWVYLYCVLSLFIYQTLDNLDGRQARRTGTSSPLGLLFDHGIDALNCTIASSTFATVISIGYQSPEHSFNHLYLLFAFWCATFIPFVFATWEEYFTGKLILPEVNGPTDGIFLCIVFTLMAYVWPGCWIRTIGENIPALEGSM